MSNFSVCGSRPGIPSGCWQQPAFFDKLIVRFRDGRASHWWTLTQNPWFEETVHITQWPKNISRLLFFRIDLLLPPHLPPLSVCLCPSLFLSTAQPWAWRRNGYINFSLSCQQLRWEQSIRKKYYWAAPAERENLWRSNVPFLEKVRICSSREAPQVNGVVERLRPQSGVEM